MSCILRFANLPEGEITDDELKQVLDEAGLTDRTDAKIVDEGGERVVYVYLPWERHIGDGVAKHLDGRLWRGHALRIAATHLFTR